MIKSPVSQQTIEQQVEPRVEPQLREQDPWQRPWHFHRERKKKDLYHAGTAGYLQQAPSTFNTNSAEQKHFFEKEEISKEQIRYNINSPANEGQGLSPLMISYRRMPARKLSGLNADEREFLEAAGINIYSEEANNPLSGEDYVLLIERTSFSPIETSAGENDLRSLLKRAISHKADESRALPATLDDVLKGEKAIISFTQSPLEKIFLASHGFEELSAMPVSCGGREIIISGMYCVPAFAPSVSHYKNGND